MLNKYLSLVTFSHTIFALPFALIGFALGVMTTDIEFQPRTLMLVVLCMVFARSAAMAFNRYLDRDIDRLNIRTQNREIPAGVITSRQGLAFVIINCFAFILTTAFINPLCFWLSPTALLIVLGYSYTKRFTSYCHLVLGLGLALAPVGAYMAVTSSIDWPIILYGLAVFTWVAGFDIIYALQDDAFDKEHGLHSIPVRFGRVSSLKISILMHVITMLALIVAGFLIFEDQFHTRYLHIIGLVTFIGLLIYQHRIISPQDLTRVNRAFFTSNGIASLAFGACVIADLLIVNTL